MSRHKDLVAFMMSHTISDIFAELTNMKQGLWESHASEGIIGF